MISTAIKIIKYFFVLCLFLVPAIALAAGSSATITVTPESDRANYRVMTVAWVADDTDGTVPTATTTAAQSQRLRGFKIVRGITDPGATAPTDNYDITITDTYGFDLFNAQLNNRDTANSEAACPIMVTECQPELVTTALTFTLTNNSVNDALGTLVIYFTTIGD